MGTGGTGSDRGPDWFAGAVLAVLLVLSLATAGDYGISWDEPIQKAYGGYLLDYYASGFRDHSAFLFSNLHYYGGAFDMVAALLNRGLDGDPYLVRHHLGAVVGVAGLAVVWRLGRVVGGARVGLLALVLLAATPSWYGDMFANPKDIPFAGAAAAVAWAMAGVLRDWPKPRPALVLGLGIALGLSLGTRVAGLILGPSLVLALAARTAGLALDEGWRPTLAATAGGVARLSAALPVMLGVVALIWPWSVLDWTHVPEAITVFSRFPFLALLPFGGELVSTTDLPRAYLPVLLAIKLPELVLLGAILAAVGGLVGARRPRRFLDGPGSQRLMLGLLVMVPLTYTVLERPVAYNGIRHFLFIVPPLAILAALALERVRRGLSSAGARRGWALCIVAGLSVPVGRMIALHPYQYIDYNLLVGGLPGAAGKFELDYWGTSLHEVTGLFIAELERRGMTTPERPYRVWICGEPMSAADLFPPYLVSVDNDEAADFTLGTSQFYCPSPRSAEHIWAQVSRLGVPLSFALDRRYP